MEENININKKILKPNENMRKLKLTRNAKINLVVGLTLVILFCIFFVMNIVIYSKLDTIELKLSRSRYFNFISIFILEDLGLLKLLKTVVDFILPIFAGIEFLIIYINIIYIILHPFIGLKLIFVVNLSHFFLIILKVIIQGHRPFWEFRNKTIIEEMDCKTDYASPSLDLFFICFFYLYSIISIQKLKKKKFKLIQRIITFLIHCIIIVIIITVSRLTLDAYFHQLIFTVILGYCLIGLLLVNDKNIHNFIFQTLKNIYNARKYKIKIFFYIIGLLIIALISSYFIDEKDLNQIKQRLKNCPNKKIFGTKESLKDISHISSIVGSVWGCSYTLEKNISKWWGNSSKFILMMKLIMSILINGVFIATKYFIPKLINDIEFNFVLDLVLNFFQNFFSFGLIPQIFEKVGLINNSKEFKKDSPAKSNNDDKIILFRTTIFKEEKDKSDEGFVLVNKEIKEEKEEKEDNNIIEEDNKENAMNISGISDENEFLYGNNKEDNEEIYGHSNLVENVQNIEEENDYLYLEGIEEQSQII